MENYIRMFEDEEAECPDCGEFFELDGECPECGRPSPLVEAGMI